jgi:hypothetical protein
MPVRVRLSEGHLHQGRRRRGRRPWERVAATDAPALLGQMLGTRPEDRWHPAGMLLA